MTEITVKERRHIADPKFVKHCLLAVAEDNKQFKASEFAKTCARCIPELQTGLLEQLKLQAKSLIVIHLLWMKVMVSQTRQFMILIQYAVRVV